MLLERPVKRGFRLISHLRACLRDADGGLNRLSRRELHAPPAEIVYGENADIVCEAIGQRVFGIALGYEDLNDHRRASSRPADGGAGGQASGLAQRLRAPAAGKSTLNRLELSRETATRYHKISHEKAAIEALFVDIFLEARARAPKEIILDLDATDDPLHGHQEGRFFHGYYDCYCYLPLYMFCGRHLLAAKLRRSNIDGSAGAVEEVARIVAQIRARWPRTRILLRADSGFAREALMAWCEENRVDFGVRPGAQRAARRGDRRRTP